MQARDIIDKYNQLTKYSEIRIISENEQEWLTQEITNKAPNLEKIKELLKSNWDHCHAKFLSQLLKNACLIKRELKNDVNLNLVALLLKYKADANGCINDFTRNNLLHEICSANKPNIALLKLLISYGGDINATNGMAMSPLMLAASNEKTTLKLIKHLLENNADCNILCSLKKTTLEYFFINNQHHLEAISIVTLLRKNHAHINLENRIDWLNKACQTLEPHLSLIKLMLDCGNFMPYCFKLAIKFNNLKLALFLLLQDANLAHQTNLVAEDAKINQLISIFKLYTQEMSQGFLNEISKNALTDYRMKSKLGTWLMGMKVYLQNTHSLFAMPNKYLKKKIASEALLLKDIAMALESFSTEECSDFVCASLKKLTALSDLQLK